MKTRSQQQVNPRLWLLPMLFSLWLSDAALALGTEDVVRLHASGYTDDEISEVLSATQSEFMLSARDVVYLSQSGVSDPIVQGMLVALPLQPVNGDGTLEAEPVRLLFTQEDLQLLAENQISEPVVVTFIETRDMAFTLDTARLTALRQSGLGLDALQILVEKSAANVTVPLAPPVVAETGGASAYFYGRSGNSLTSYNNPMPSSYSYYGSPSVYIQSRTIYPWYGYEFEPRYGYSPGYGYGYGSGFGYGSSFGYGSGFGYGFGYGSGFIPHYAAYYPNPWNGFYGHSFYCPRDRHYHGGRGHHDGKDHDGGHHGDHDNDWDGRGGNSLAGVKPEGTKPGGTTPGGTKPGRGTSYYFGGNTGNNIANNTVGPIWGTRTNPVSGTGQIIRATGDERNGNRTAGVYFGNRITSTGTKPVTSTGHYNAGKPYKPATVKVSGNPGTQPVVYSSPVAMGAGGNGPGNLGLGIRNSGSGAAETRTLPGTSSPGLYAPRSGVTPAVADTPSTSSAARPTRGRSSSQEDGTAGRAPRFRAGTSTNSVADPGRRVKPQ